MITNRTIADVNDAKNIRDTVIKAMQTPTQAQIATLERGMLTINTLNRIEQKEAEVKELLNEIGYYGNRIDNKIDWDMSDYFKSDDFKRILENLRILEKSFFVKSTTPQIPNAAIHYETLNAIEQILVDLNDKYIEITENYRECGNFECGGDLF